MESLPSPNVIIADDSTRERAKMRLYVLMQLIGWGIFLALQIVFSIGLTMKSGAAPHGRLCQVAIIVMISALGLLISHYGRALVSRWGWKNLGWRALLRRILGFSALQALVWISLGFAWPYLVLRYTWPSETPWPMVFALTWLNSTVAFIGWHCIYFFYHLFDRYNRLEIERLRLGGAVKEAELRALKSQVNPHFIFNALNSLRALIDEDPARARQAVTQLANLLRYSLQSAQAETVAFEDELRVVNDYLALEQVRHEERLRLRFDIAPETLGLAVPPLLLQTLVENAVKYGISNRPEGGEIVIIARCEDGQLRLRVTNPGVISQDRKAGAGSSSTGLGLRNAAERLRLFFGDRAQLQLRSETPTLVVAEVSLPVQITRA